MSVLPWRRVTALDEPETTQVYEPEPTSPKASLDYFAAEVRRAQNEVVQCQCALARAETKLEDAAKNFVSSVGHVAKDFARLGITLRLDDE